MDKQEFIKKMQVLIADEGCCDELKVVGQKWIDAVGTDQEVDAAKSLATELEEDIMTVDEVISAMEDANVIQHLGAKMAKEIADHTKEIKAAGAKYCDCPACVAAYELLQNKKVLFD